MSFRKSFLATTSLCTGVLLAALAGPAFAADQSGAASSKCAPSDKACQAEQSQTGQASQPTPTAVNEIVVTGSRIKTTTFTSPAPLSVITSDQAQLTGQVDTSQILQLSTVAANAVQINNFFTGFITTGGPGVNTLSLRGLGAQRTLFLLNGQRLGPAGVGGTVGPFDLNVIPASIVDHIDILKDGASSIYGSDAVAGVVNIVTKTNQDGIDIHAHVEPSQEGGGNVYQTDVSWGKTFDKGYVSASLSYYRQDPLTLGQRSYLSCAQDRVADATTGQPADLIDPATGKSKCFNILTDTVVDLAFGFQEYRVNSGAVAGGGPEGIDVNGFQAVGLVFGDPALTRASAALEPENDPRFLQNTAISPDSRYTFTLMGQYDLTSHVQAYGSLLLNQRDSEQNLVDQFFVVPLNPGNPYNEALGVNPNTGCAGFCYPVPVLMQDTPATQTVNYVRGVIGFKGDLPNRGSLKNWTFDVYGQYSYDWATGGQVYARQDRVNATAGAGDGTNGCDINAVWVGGESMAQAEPGVACVPVNYIAAVTNGAFTPAEQAFLYTKEYDRTTYSQAYIDGSMTGDLLDLPAGPLGAAVGFELRREAIDDVPGADFIAQNVYNYTTEGVTKGSVDAEEVYGELKAPILKGAPFAYGLDLDLSGRFSNYSSYGSNFTYKATVDWRLSDYFEIRGTYGTAFRAPALYELFLANQVGFLGQFGLDPCINYGTSGVSQVVKNNCASQGIPANYSGEGQSAVDLTGGGAGHLKAETSLADTLGFVLTPKWGDQDISFAADWYNFDIANEIQQFGASNILSQCYGSTNFPSNPFCSLFTRNGATQSGGYDPFNIEQVNNDYVNVAKEVDQGIDVDLRYSTHLPHDFKLTLESSLAWTLYTNTVLLGGQVNNYLGSIGQPNWVGNVDFKFDRGPWTFNWLVYMVGPSNDAPFIDTEIFDYNETGQNVVGTYRAGFYSLSDVAIRRKFDKFTVEFGVKNLFNQAPPEISAGDAIQSRLGNVPLASQYDLIGRSFYFDVDAKF